GMKKRYRSLLSMLLVTVMLFSVVSIPAQAVEDDLVEQLINQLYATRYKEEFFGLFKAFQEVNDPVGLSNAYASAFGALSTSQQSRIESFGVTVDVVRVLADKTNDAQVSETVIRRWLSTDTPEYRAELRAFIERKLNVIVSIGDASKILSGFTRMDKVFSILGLVRIFATNGQLAFVEVDANHKNMTLLEAKVPEIVGYVNDMIQDDISDTVPVVEALKAFPLYYNSAETSDQEIIFTYLNTYRFVNVLAATNPGGNTPGGNAGGVTEGNAGGGNAGGNGNGRINGNEIDIYDEETAQGLNFTVVPLTEEQLLTYGAKEVITVDGNVIGKLSFTNADDFADILNIETPKLSLLFGEDLDGVDIRINGAIVELLAAHDGAVFVDTKIGTYELDAKKLAAQFTKELGKGVVAEDVTVRIRFSKVKGTALDAVKASISADKEGELVSTPMNYILSFILKEEETELATVPMFIERRLVFDQANMATAAILVGADGSTKQVPARIYEVDGVWFAAINSRNNGTFALTQVNKGFKDISSHWAKEMIQELANHLMIQGVDAENFQPQRQITRAEMAT
ncbi:MAG: S-layer homology domain-containing protein, partial [Vallitaleaceae bacterium]|nr:S-layer homology domain-containing protein [Vallitaleaceae bacterium]